MRALIDGDIIKYRVGFASEHDDLSIAIHRCDSMLDGILDATQADNFRIFLTDSLGNFRKKVWSLYQANRTKEKPRWYNEIQEYLKDHWKAEVAHGQEADDALGIHQDKTSINPSTTICSIDKDLKQIPGLHFNFVTEEFDNVSELEGTYWFYRQLLMGDPVDNVQGAPGIGKAKSEKLLTGIEEELALYQVVHNTYHTVFGKMNLSTQEINDILVRNGRLLYIRRRKDEIWNPPSQSTIHQLESTPIMGEDSILSTELTTQETMNGYVLHGLEVEPNLKGPDQSLTSSNPSPT